MKRIRRAWRPVASGVVLAVVIALWSAGVSRGQTNPAPATGGGEAGQVAGGRRGAERLSFLQLLMKGGVFMIPMAACSLVGMAVALERALALRKGVVIPRGFLTGLENVYRGPKDTEAGIRYCQASGSPIGRVMAAGIRKLPQGEAAAERAFEDAGANEVAKFRRNLRTLYGISAIAPTLGLLGTVWGMIDAFQVGSTVGLGRSEELMRGIYEALVATMTGLAIAVPVLMFYYLFLGQIDKLVGAMNDACGRFLEHVLPQNRQPVVTVRGVGSAQAAHAHGGGAGAPSPAPAELEVEEEATHAHP